MQPGEKVHIIWAYDDEDITNNSTFDIHIYKGWTAQKFVMVPEAPIPTEAAALSQRACSYGIVTLTAVIVTVLVK